MQPTLRKKAFSSKNDQHSDGRSIAERASAARKRIASKPDAVKEEIPEESAVVVDFEKLRDRVQKVVQFSTFEQNIKFRLQTKHRHLQRVLGSEDAGIPYGKMIELSGLEHGGKTLIGLLLMMLAQLDGAHVGKMDLENSDDEHWDKRIGINRDVMILISPKLIKRKVEKEEDGKKKSPFPKGRKSKMKASDPARIEGAEELFAEMEANMAALYEQGVKKQLWLIDSLAMLTTVKQIEAGSQGQTMNTNLDVPVFLAKELPKLSGMAANYNAAIVIINQLRNKIGMVFGDPFDTPGGRAVRHAFGNRTRVKRLKNGMLRQGQHVTGLVGILSNEKNKMGYGSVQSEKCGFKVSWRKEQIEFEFMSVKDAEALLAGGE